MYPLLRTTLILGGFYYPNKCIGRGLKHHNEMDRYPLNPKRTYRADDLRHPLHNLLVEGIQRIPDGLEEVRGAAGVVPVPGGH